MTQVREGGRTKVKGRGKKTRPKGAAAEAAEPTGACPLSSDFRGITAYGFYSTFA